MAEVDVISSCLVEMAGSGHSAAVPGKVLELTPWELRCLLIGPIQKGILFYKPDRFLQHDTTFIDCLKNSLSRTLDFFPTLSGRLGTIENSDSNAVAFFVDCNDAGVEFRYAVAGGVTVSDVLEPKYTPKIVSSFFQQNADPNWVGVSKPLLSVQVTELADGLFIGCTANHVVIDGTSFWHFFNSWAEISRCSDTISKVPVFERWFPQNVPNESRLIHLPPLDQNPTCSIAPSPLLERVFSFSKDSLGKLKAKANSEAGSSKISTLQALSAHLWRSVVRSRLQQSVGNNMSKQQHRCTLLVGVRSRIPLQEGYFGCAVYDAGTVISGHELLENGLGFAAMKINETVSQLTSEAAIKFAEDWVDTPKMVGGETLEFVISSSPQFDVYGCDFGWGKPIAVRSGIRQKFDGKMTVYPAMQPGGIDVEVCLAPEMLKAMDDDAEFMEAVTV